MEDIARQAFRMHAHEDVLDTVDVAFHQRDVLLLGEDLAVGDGSKLSELGRKPHRHHALDELLGAPAILDEVGHGDHLQFVALAEAREIGDACHRPVVVHDLADDACRDHAREPGEVDRRLGLARAPEDAASLRAQRKDVARLHEVVGHRAGVDRDLDRACPVVSRDPGRNAFARLDRDREGGAERRLVVVGHGPQVELVAALGSEAEADEAAAVRGHERDRLGRDELCRDREVALVLAVGVIDDDDEPTGANLLDRLVDRREGRRRRRRSRTRCHASDRSPHRALSRSTYFASTSASRFTAWPGRSEDSVVASSVCGTSATAKASELSSATVSETPSIVIDPFSTQ